LRFLSIQNKLSINVSRLNDHHADWGIETSRVYPSTSPRFGLNDHHADWGIETCDTSVVCGHIDSLNDHHADWGIETWGGSRHSDFLACVWTTITPIEALKHANTDAVNVEHSRLNDHHADW
jgi:hypothetical protein